MGKKQRIRKEKIEQEKIEKKTLLKQIYHEKNPWIKFWKRVDFWIYAVCLIAIMAFPFVKKGDLKMGDTAVLHTSMGDIEVELYEKDAPKTVENFQKLSEKNYYNGILFHRVIKGFMIQGGDPTGTGTGGESAFGAPFADEINTEGLGLTEKQISDLVAKGYAYNTTLKSHKMTVGSLAMANFGPNTNGSQFFIITEQNQPHLDGQHTVFGKVIKGLDIAKAISEVPVDENDKPINPVYLNSVELK